MQNDAYNEAILLYDALLDDVGVFCRELATDPSQRCRRSYVRAVFAMIEGVTFCIKQMALDENGSPKALSPAEQAMILEEGYGLDESGNVIVKNATLPTLANLRFAFGVFAKRNGSNYKLDVSGEGWQSLRRSLAVRHRLMHPKSSKDITVSKEEIEDAGCALR